jgi:hypothetical protein
MASGDKLLNGQDAAGRDATSENRRRTHNRCTWAFAGLANNGEATPPTQWAILSSMPL